MPKSCAIRQIYNQINQLKKKLSIFQQAYAQIKWKREFMCERWAMMLYRKSLALQAN